MRNRFDLDSTAAAALEVEYLGAVKRTVGAWPGSAVEVIGLTLEGTYPDTELVASVSIRNAVRELRFGLWDESFQESEERPEDPGYLASALVTQIFEEGAC